MALQYALDASPLGGSAVKNQLRISPAIGWPAYDRNYEFSTARRSRALRHRLRPPAEAMAQAPDGSTNKDRLGAET
jgi:hypothetical protein